ncbi:MAG: hypothetical protein N3H84_07820 [Candidatus Caldarchaeum sp.]|nr:hypothetical protein [Candidatus Caldarchaeum sp.]
MAKAFKELALLCEKLEATNSKNEKIKHVVNYLRTFHPSEYDEARYAALLLVGISSGIRRIGTNIGPSTLFKAYSQKQALLFEFQPLTISGVWNTVRNIMKASGNGVLEIRKSMLSNLFARGDEVERKWLLRMLMGEMRHGVNAGLLVEALADYAGKPVENLRTADMLLGDLGELTRKTLENRLDEI